MDREEALMHAGRERLRPDPDDHLRADRRHDAGGHRHRRGRRVLPPDGGGDHRRHDHLDPADAAGDPELLRQHRDQLGPPRAIKFWARAAVYNPVNAFFLTLFEFFLTSADAAVLSTGWCAAASTWTRRRAPGRSGPRRFEWFRSSGVVEPAPAVVAAPAQRRSAGYAPTRTPRVPSEADLVAEKRGRDLFSHCAVDRPIFPATSDLSPYSDGDGDFTAQFATELRGL